MTDYYDGPRGGIADFGGKPHAYTAVFDPDEGYAETFLLMPIGEQIFRWALEDWEIWRRWETAFHDGKASQDTHPALPEDRARHEELERLLGDSLTAVPELSIEARAERRGTFPGDAHGGVEVRWTPVTND